MPEVQNSENSIEKKPTNPANKFRAAFLVTLMSLAGCSGEATDTQGEASSSDAPEPLKPPIKLGEARQPRPEGNGCGGKRPGSGGSGGEGGNGGMDGVGGIIGGYPDKCQGGSEG